MGITIWNDKNSLIHELHHAKEPHIKGENRAIMRFKEGVSAEERQQLHNYLQNEVGVEVDVINLRDNATHTLKIAGFKTDGQAQGVLNRLKKDRRFGMKDLPHEATIKDGVLEISGIPSVRWGYELRKWLNWYNISTDNGYQFTASTDEKSLEPALLVYNAGKEKSLIHALENKGCIQGKAEDELSNIKNPVSRGIKRAFSKARQWTAVLWAWADVQGIFSGAARSYMEGKELKDLKNDSEIQQNFLFGIGTWAFFFQQFAKPRSASSLFDRLEHEATTEGQVNISDFEIKKNGDIGIISDLKYLAIERYAFDLDMALNFLGALQGYGARVRERPIIAGRSYNYEKYRKDGTSIPIASDGVDGYKAFMEDRRWLRNTENQPMGDVVLDQKGNVAKEKAFDPAQYNTGVLVMIAATIASIVPQRGGTEPVPVDFYDMRKRIDKTPIVGIIAKGFRAFGKTKIGEMLFYPFERFIDWTLSRPKLAFSVFALGHNIQQVGLSLDEKESIELTLCKYELKQINEANGLKWFIGAEVGGKSILESVLDAAKGEEVNVEAIEKLVPEAFKNPGDKSKKQIAETIVETARQLENTAFGKLLKDQELSNRIANLNISIENLFVPAPIEEKSRGRFQQTLEAIPGLSSIPLLGNIITDRYRNFLEGENGKQRMTLSNGVVEKLDDIVNTFEQQEIQVKALKEIEFNLHNTEDKKSVLKSAINKLQDRVKELEELASDIPEIELTATKRLLKTLEKTPPADIKNLLDNKESGAVKELEDRRADYETALLLKCFDKNDTGNKERPGSMVTIPKLELFNIPRTPIGGTPLERPSAPKRLTNYYLRRRDEDHVEPSEFLRNAFIMGRNNQECMNLLENKEVWRYRLNQNAVYGAANIFLGSSDESAQGVKHNLAKDTLSETEIYRYAAQKARDYAPLSGISEQQAVNQIVNWLLVQKEAEKAGIPTKEKTVVVENILTKLNHGMAPTEIEALQGKMQTAAQDAYEHQEEVREEVSQRVSTERENIEDKRAAAKQRFQERFEQKQTPKRRSISPDAEHNQPGYISEGVGLGVATPAGSS